jgi:magnesium chelatase accessory protein
VFPFSSHERLAFARDGADWPNREASGFVEAGGFSWHVQRMGAGPELLMLHGTGASTHSWEKLAPLLARRFRVAAPDLPGHGFTTAKKAPDLSLPGMARSVAALLTALDFQPQVVVGHSAGAAILARLCLDSMIAPKLFVSLNGAFLPFEGSARFLFPSMARLLFLNPLTPRLFAWSATDTSVANLLRGTGSKIERRGVELYVRLLANPNHVAGALGMMANWDLTDLRQNLPDLKARLVLIVGQDDKAIPPQAASLVAAAIPGAVVETISHTGHLAHEEQPERIHDLILGYAARSGVGIETAPRCGESPSLSDGSPGRRQLFP